MRRILSLSAVVIGICCIFSAAFLFWENTQEEQLAQTVSEDVVHVLSQEIENQATMLPAGEDNFAEELSAPVITVEEARYIGVLSIPQLGLTLPISETWSYAKLETTPCAYAGKIADGNFVIAAHNFQAHFGNIGELNLGDEISIQDTSGVTHNYSLVLEEIIDGDDFFGLLTGDWDLTLFTCLYGNNTQRVVLRFAAI